MRDPVLRGAGLSDGRGRPVLLIPGFMAGDVSLELMAGWLRRAGYRTTRAGMRANVDCSGAILERLEKRLDWIVGEQGKRAVVIGQSRGGGLAKVLARRRPDLVCGIVTLGSPQLDPLAVHPLVRLQVEAVGRLGSLGAPGLFRRSCLDGECCAGFWEGLAAPLPDGVGLRVGLLAQRRRGGLARLPGPQRRRARGDRRQPLRHGREPGRVARRGLRARRLQPQRGRAHAAALGRGHAPAEGGLMERARIDVSKDIDGAPVVFACFDLGAAELGASAHAVAATINERFSLAQMSADDVVELRELTALADELGELTSGAGSLVLRPARLSAYRAAIARFVESRDSAEWIREDDREPLAVTRGLLAGLEQLCAEAMRAALEPESAQRRH